jgi:hypothetical protein
MARIRTIKPEFFTSSDITKLTPLARLFYVSLWCEADREGLLKWDVDTLKQRYLPADDVDIEELSAELHARGLIAIYIGDDGREYAFIPSFKDHQVINNRESESTLAARVKGASPRVQAEGKEGREGKGKEGKGTLTAVAAESGEKNINFPAKEKQSDADFELAFAAFPKRLGGNPKHDALKSWNARIADGVDPAEMIAGTERYAEFNRATGKTGTEFVMQAVRFFGKSKHYAEPWQAEAPPARPSRSTAAMGANAQDFDDPFAQRAAP